MNKSGLKIFIYFFSFALLSFFISGCSFIAKLGYGAKKPKTENEHSIKNWLTRYNFSTENLFTVAPEYYYEFIPGLSQAPLLFDTKTGNFLAIGFNNGKYCPKETDKSFSSILPYFLLKEKPDSFLIAETIEIPKGGSVKDENNYIRKKDTIHLNLQLIQKKIKLPGGNAANVTNNNEDYILVIPFSLFFGNKVQVQEMKKFFQSAQLNRFASIKTVFLNLDKQEWWGEEWNQKIKIK